MIKVEHIQDNLLATFPRGYLRHPVSKQTVAHTVSHLEAIRKWLEKDEAEAIFHEDVEWLTWPWTWDEVREHVPHTFDVFQMCVEFEPRSRPEMRMHRRMNERSTACYVMTRGHAQKLMRLYHTPNGYDLTSVYPCAGAEEVLFDSGLTYTMPLVVQRHSGQYLDTQHSGQEHSDTQHLGQEHSDKQENHTRSDETYSTELVRLFWNEIHRVDDPYLLFR